MPSLCTWTALLTYLNNGGKKKTFLSANYDGGIEANVTVEHISHGQKAAAAALDYPSLKGIPIERINTHLLRSGRASALALRGVSDMQIQKIGCWKSATFKKYVHKELMCFSTGMSSAMKTKFGFVNVTGTTFHDVTDIAVASEYKTMIEIIG
jgi:hypothetical protein